jgi:hypothetical protein
MKIRTDSVPLQSPSYRSHRKISTAENYSSAQSLRNVPQNININLNIEKALSEALSIAQLSRNIIEKAQIAVSSLRSTEAPEQRISEIITEYKTAAPSISEKKQIFTQNNIKEIPSLANDIDRLSAMRNKSAQPAEIDSIDLSLKSKIESVQISIDQIEKRITDLYPVNSRKNTSLYTELLTHTALMIIKNADTALAMQGNISRESINRLNIA